MPKRILQGTVVSDKGDKTVVVTGGYVDNPDNSKRLAGLQAAYAWMAQRVKRTGAASDWIVDGATGLHTRSWALEQEEGLRPVRSTSPAGRPSRTRAARQTRPAPATR